MQNTGPWSARAATACEIAPQQQAKPAKIAAASEALASWLNEIEIDASDANDALESIAWAHALPLLADHLEPDVWQAALEKLLQTVTVAAKAPAEGRSLAAQLLTAELPLTLAYWFDEIAACRRLEEPARKAAAALLEAAVDAEGVVHAPCLPWLRPLLASWTRLAAIEQSRPRHDRLFSAPSRFGKAVAQALRLARPDGSQAFDEPSVAARSQDARQLFRGALAQAGAPARSIAALALPAALEPRRRAAEKSKPTSKQPAPGFNSESSRLAVLRTSWRPADPRLTVAYDNERLRAELLAERELLWSGDWNPEIEWNQERLQPVAGWEEVCWVSDEDVDYLELQLSLSGGVRIQRHLLLARQDRFLFAADAVLGERPGAIAYRSTLPLTSGIRFVAAKDSREGKLAKRRACGLVLPLALPEWRAAASCGILSQTEAGLELRQSAASARSMFAPLFIDLAPRRFSQPFTWRRLTVAENRRILPDDLAVGYRVQVGAQQWLFYRSLGPRGNRTLLGHNLVSEFLAARFNWDGVAESLLEIEG